VARRLGDGCRLARPEGKPVKTCLYLAGPEGDSSVFWSPFNPPIIQRGDSQRPRSPSYPPWVGALVLARATKGNTRSSNENHGCSASAKEYIGRYRSRAIGRLNKTLMLVFTLHSW